MDSFCRGLDKAELHLHLEGAVAPSTLRELAPGLTEEEIRAHYEYRDFDGFLDSFKWVTSFLRSPDDYALVTFPGGEQRLGAVPRRQGPARRPGRTRGCRC